MTCMRCVTPSTCSWNGCSPGTMLAEPGQICQVCNGAGNVEGEPCKPCDRTGRVQEWPINKERKRRGLPPITQCEVASQTEEQRTIATIQAFGKVLEVIGRQNASMALTTAERQRAFKEAMKEAGFVRLEAYVTKEQREKFRRLGGDEWLRKKIDTAKDKK